MRISSSWPTILLVIAVLKAFIIVMMESTRSLTSIRSRSDCIATWDCGHSSPVLLELSMHLFKCCAISCKLCLPASGVPSSFWYSLKLCHRHPSPFIHRSRWERTIHSARKRLKKICKWCRLSCLAFLAWHVIGRLISLWWWKVSTAWHHLWREV